MRGSWAVRMGVGEGCVGGQVGPVFVADEEAEEGAALFGDVVADGVAEHGVGGLEGVEDGGDGGGGGDVEGGLVGGEVGEAAEVEGEIDADEGHGGGWNRSGVEESGRAIRAMPTSQNRDMGHPDLGRSG